MALNRRQFIQTSTLGTLGATGLSGCLMKANQPLTLAEVKPEHQYELLLKPGVKEIIPGKPSNVLTMNGLAPGPVIRGKQNEPIRITVVNQLDTATTMHWHGLRIPVDMDGVPYTGQMPIEPGESFVYQFTPPDAGTMWYHPHMESVEQMGKGLVGAMVIEEAEPLEFDLDIPLVLKNWHLNEDGSFYPRSIKRYAARQGTPGLINTVNGKIKPKFSVPAGGRIRIRTINADNTAQYQLNCEQGQVLAIDANPIDFNQTLESFLLGTGVRMDFGFIAPQAIGEQFTLRDGDQIIAEFEVVPSSLPTLHSQLPKIPANPVLEPNLAEAKQIGMTLEWDAATDKNGDPLFWNLKTRPGQRPANCSYPNQIANLKLGNSYIFNIRNNTQYPHPIHFHGHTFRVLKSNKKTINPFLADTVVLEKNEQVQVGLVADNPGFWMFHCHVIEHMISGLVGLVKVA